MFKNTILSLLFTIFFISFGQLAEAVPFGSNANRVRIEKVRKSRVDNRAARNAKASKPEVEIIYDLIDYDDADECPIEFSGNSNYMQDVLDAIEASPAPSFSEEIVVACGMGSSMDVALAGAVSDQYKEIFKDRMTSSLDALYEKYATDCSERSVEFGGTMGMSIMAFCELKIAKNFALQLPPN